VTLQKLILSGNNLRNLPAAIADLVMLHTLDISKNPLKVRDAEDVTCLPVDMRLMKNLKVLNLSECNLRIIPVTVFICTSIQRLDLSRNKIGLLVAEVANMQSLTHLNLSQCDLSTLPPEIAFCAELEELVLMSNTIESLPESLKECKSLKYLRVSYKNFTTLLDAYMETLIRKGQIKSEHIPAVVFELENLRELNLKGTKINNFPDNSLNNLEELQLEGNFFDTIPELAFRPMSGTLRVLTLSYNQLKDIPDEINNLTSLQVLDLSFNQIETLPSKFVGLESLLELNLGNNKLVELSMSLLGLQSLEKLNLERNQLSSIHDCVYELGNLAYLDLSYNQIALISPKICKLKSMRLAHSYVKLNKTGLWIIGNPLHIPGKEVWQTTKIYKIYEYLANYSQRTSKFSCYAKLVFVGLSGIGKSHLVNNLFDVKFEVHSTHQTGKCLFYLFFFSFKIIFRFLAMIPSGLFKFVFPAQNINRLV
jgi:Leucine-rich repeat (LRR) protein